MVCQQCGATSDEGQRFCYNCGARLEVQPASEPQALPPTAFGQPSIAPPTSPQSLPQQPMPLGQPGYQQQMPGAYLPQAVPNSNLAIISLVSGIIAWVMLPLLGALVAVITGHMARNEIRNANGTLSGDGLATIGLVLGYAQLALTVLAVCAGVVILVVLGLSA